MYVRVKIDKRRRKENKSNAVRFFRPDFCGC